MGHSHQVKLAVSPTSGIEVGMPRDGWYARGIAFDASGRWAESYRSYVRARERYSIELRRRPGAARLIRGWIAKAKYQMVQSSRLLSLGHPLGGIASNVPRLFDRASVLHVKWLAIRAFAGRGPEKLTREAIKYYRLALARQPGHRSSRIGLATLLHEMGRHEQGRREYRKVIVPVPRWLDVELAHYHTAAGDQLRALMLLHRATNSNQVRQYVIVSNDFDPLRSLPVFRRLLAL